MAIPCLVLTIAWSVFAMIIFVLVIHHAFIHKDMKNKFSRVFQLSDLCNLETFNHEMFEVALWGLGFACGISQLLLSCELLHSIIFLVVYMLFLLLFCIVISMQAFVS